jgi:hypothetical protein
MRAFIRHVLPFAGCLLAVVPAHAQPADATSLSGRWTGTYDCIQGATALELSLRGNAHGIVQGTFAFSATPQNPDVLAGSYPVMGRYTGTSLVLRPIDVTDMPGSYVPVGILATVTGRRMAGWIAGPGCGAIEVTRTEAARAGDPLPGGYGQQRWAPVMEDNGGRLSMDIRERHDMGASVDRGWVRWESRANEPAFGLRAGETTVWEVEFDCNANLARVWHTLVYGPDGQLISFEDSVPYQWAEIEDGSMYDHVSDHACFGALLPAERP